MSITLTKKSQLLQVHQQQATGEASYEELNKIYDQVILKGEPDGLFRACMNSLRESHHDARRIRTALILVGLFTDKKLYREWLSIFYALTFALEEKMKSYEFEQPLDDKEKEVLRKLKAGLGKYYFSELYELDLSFLYEKKGGDLTNEVRYCSTI